MSEKREIELSDELLELLRAFAEQEKKVWGGGRSANRVYPFLDDVGTLWKQRAADEQFCALMARFLNANGDPFYWEEDRFLEKLRAFLENDPETEPDESRAAEIDALLYAIAEPWKNNLPDWRFGQLLFNFLSESGVAADCPDPQFFCALQAYLGRYGRKK